MAAAHFDKVFPTLIKHEAGFQNSPSDRGNYCGNKLVGTKYGVGALAYKAVYGICPSPDTMRNLTLQQAKFVWKTIIFDIFKGDFINSEGICAQFIFAMGGGGSGYKSMRETINAVAGKEVTKVSSSIRVTQTEIDFINQNSKAFFFEFHNNRMRYLKNHPNLKKFPGWIPRQLDIYNQYKNSFDVVVKKSSSPFS